MVQRISDLTPRIYDALKLWNILIEGKIFKEGRAEDLAADEKVKK